MSKEPDKQANDADPRAQGPPTWSVSARVVAWRARLSETLLGGRYALLIPVICAVILITFPFWSGDQYWTNQIENIAILTLVVSGVNLSFGYAGEVQFGQVFMFAIGAYVTMILAVHGFNEVVALLIIGGLVASAVGFVVALPAVRIGGWSLAMVSFFLVITIPDFAQIFQSKTGGDNGLIGIPSPQFFGATVGTNGLFEISLVVALLWVTCFRNLVTSRYGVIFRILRESPVQARSLGFSTVRLKVMAYTLGALPAGIAGCLFGYVSLVISPTDFGLNLAIGIVAASVLGGVESVYGAILGATILQLGPQESTSFASAAPVAYGAFLMVAAVVLRGGIGGLARVGAVKLSRRVVGVDDTSSAVTSRGSLSAHELELPAEEFRARHHARSGISDGLDGQKLIVTAVSKAFGGAQALQEVSLDAEPGKITALIGSNGSGKTTLLNIICGYTEPDSGSIACGRPLTRMPPHRIATVGVGRTFQTPSIPRGVSALDVVASGRFHLEATGVLSSILRLPGYRRARRADRAEALELLDLVGLLPIADLEASSQPLGNRRLIEIARSLCGRPNLLLLDEPASGLSDDEVGVLGAAVKAAARAGATVVLIEHNFGFVGRISDTAHVLHLGRLIASGTAAEVSADPRVIESYLGESSVSSGEQGTKTANVSQEGRAAPPVQPTVRPALLEARDVRSGYGDLQVLHGVSLTLHEGQVEVLLGRNGVGKTTLLSTICGEIKLSDGAVLLGSEDIGKRPAYRRAAEGLALVQEGKRIFRNRTIMENVLLGTCPLKLSRSERSKLCESILEQFPVLRDRAGERAGGLSGGQQQMLAIATALASRPRVLLLDEPSAGLAPAIVTDLFERIRALSDDGIAILLVEQLAQHALRIADHVTVLEDGRITRSGVPGDFHDLRELQEAYFGASGATLAL